jgi:hypothetical protein
VLLIVPFKINSLISLCTAINACLLAGYFYTYISLITQFQYDPLHHVSHIIFFTMLYNIHSLRHNLPRIIIRNSFSLGWVGLTLQPARCIYLNYNKIN